MARSAIAALATGLGIIASLAACGGGSGDDLTITGTMSTPSLGYRESGPSCTSDKGYDDISVGTQVTVTQSEGKVIALGRLDGVSLKSYRCVFTFVIEGVPDDEEIYGIEVSHRGVLNYSRDDLDLPVALSLGS